MGLKSSEKQKNKKVGIIKKYIEKYDLRPDYIVIKKYIEKYDLSPDYIIKLSRLEHNKPARKYTEFKNHNEKLNKLKDDKKIKFFNWVGLTIAINTYYPIDIFNISNFFPNNEFSDEEKRELEAIAVEDTKKDAEKKIIQEKNNKIQDEINSEVTSKLPIDNVTNKIRYSEVVYVDSTVNNKELFLILNEWFAKTYKNSKNVIEFKDKEIGKIVGKANMSVNVRGLFGSGFSSHTERIQYLISISVKNGKYKCEVTDFFPIDDLGLGVNMGDCDDWLNNKKNIGFGVANKSKMLNDILNQIDKKINDLLSELKLFVKTKESEIKNDDW